MPAILNSFEEPANLSDALRQLRSERMIAEKRESAARMLMIRADYQISQWNWKHKNAGAPFLQPEGDIDIQLDMDAWIAGE